MIDCKTIVLTIVLVGQGLMGTASGGIMGFKIDGEMPGMTISMIGDTIPGPTGNALRIRSLKEWGAFKMGFARPGKEYGSAPLWVWNTRVTDGMIDTALVDFKAKGFGGVFVHPRAGLITAYLSEDWFARWKHTVEVAKRLGMDVWIYDENSYPSGFAGGHVPDAMPSSYNQGQMLAMRKDSVWKGAPADAMIILEKLGEGFVAVQNGRPAGSGPYYIFTKTYYYKSPWYGGFSYVDLMVKGVTEEFLHQTMPGYERAVGDEFGKTVKGIFSDEPNIEVQYPHNLRWTPDLFSTFADRWGYRLEEQLPSLLEDVGDWKKVRHDYYAVLLQLFIDRWSKPYSHLTDSLHLEWTGHYWEHEWPDPNHGPDNMAMYAWPQRPGVDMLFNQFNENHVNAQFGNVRAIKELASVTNQLGKGRNLSETYGGGGWELTYKDMKRLGDWEFVLGVNTLNQHLAFMTITGSRKYDYPQSFSYHNPWWPHYKYLNDYFTRLTWALTRGEEVNPVLVLEPTTSTWMYAAYDATKPVMHDMGSRFQAFVTRLTKRQIEYDLGSEDIIHDHGSVRSEGAEGARFVIGRRAYSVVVIPPGTENIDSITYLLLREYVGKGGRLDIYSRLSRLNGRVFAGPKDVIDERIFSSETDDTEAEKAAVMEGQRIRATAGYPQRFLHPWEGGDLYHQRRVFDGGELIFLSNASMDSSVKGELTMPGDVVYRMDLFTGYLELMPGVSKNGNVQVPFVVPPAGSALYVALDEGMPGMWMMRRDLEPLRAFKASPMRVKRTTANTLMIDFCDVRIGDTLLKDRHVYDAADTVYKFFGFGDGNPWNTSVQYKDRTVVRDHFGSHTGFEASYHFRIKEGVDVKGLSLVVEQPRLWHVYVNGHPVTALPGKWWLDRNFGVYAAGAYLRVGENTVEVKASPMSVYAEVEPIYIRGEMGVAPADKGWEIVASQPLHAGSWKEQGMPLYGESVSYERKVVIEKGNGKTEKMTGMTFVQLGRWKGTVATVQVNGRDAGVIGLDSYPLDIDEYLHPGENTVRVVVTGSLKNLLGPHHNKPAPGLVSPWHWRYVKGYPSGREYDTTDYGLIDEFQIMTER